jgi:predicted metal-dependent hydrolase
MHNPSDDPYVRGARLFDAGAFFEAHEAWEERWRLETDPSARRFLQGLIQIAAAFHKLVVSGSPASASRLLAKGTAKLDTCPDQIAARNLAAFLHDVHACGLALAAKRFDASSSIPKIGH